MVESEGLKSAIMASVEAHRETVLSVLDALYRNPETGLREYASSALLSEMLERGGFVLERGLAGMETAFRARWGDGGPGIAILAEMDALPELGHACGHNVIAAAAIGAALALRNCLPPELARITVLGTPAEEMGIGKVDLIRAGVFAGIDFAMMVHPSSRRQVIKESLGLAKVRFRFTGKPSHAAAYPEDGINALDAVIQTFNGINALRQQLRQDVRVHGIITDGGVAPNVIPERAACYFYVRADDLAELERSKERVVACAYGAALATGCTLDLEEGERVLAPLRVNRRYAALYSEQLRYLGLEESTTPVDRNKGSSDIGNVSQVLPTIHPHVPIGDGVRIHTEAFARASVSDAGRRAALEGATCMALTVLDLALHEELRNDIREEFQKNFT
jgi:amidohydrolase